MAEKVEFEATKESIKDYLFMLQVKMSDNEMTDDQILELVQVLKEYAEKFECYANL